MENKLITFFALILMLGFVSSIPVSTPNVTLTYPNGDEVFSSSNTGIILVKFNVLNPDIANPSTTISIDNYSSKIADFNLFNGYCENYSVNPLICSYQWNLSNFPISDGNHTILVGVHTDIDESDSEFIFDSISPLINYIFPKNNSWINPDKNLFSFGLTDALSGIESSSVNIQLNGIDYNSTSSRINLDLMSGKLDFNLFGVDVNNGQTYYLLISASDRAENQKTKTLNFSVDKNSPIITNFNAPSITNLQKPLFVINAVDQNGLSGLNKIYFSCNKTEWLEETYSSSTFNDFNIISPEWGCNDSDGNKIIFFKVSDKATNFSEIYEATILFDSTPPATLINYSSEGGWVDGWTNADLDFNISCSEENSKINYWIYNYGVLREGAIIDSNFYSGKITIEGENEIIANCQDFAGNKDSNFSVIFGIDENLPNTPMLFLPSVQNSADVFVSWTSAKRLSDVTYFIWKKESTDSDFVLIAGPLLDLNYNDTDTNLDSNYCYFVQAFNSFGIDANSSIKCVLIDRNQPYLFSFDGTQQSNTYSILFDFNATDYGGGGVVKYWIRLSEGEWIDVSSNKKYTVTKNGTYTFFGKITDAALNDSNDSNTIVVVNVKKESPGSGDTGGGGALGNRPKIDVNSRNDSNEILVVATETVFVNDLNQKGDESKNIDSENGLELIIIERNSDKNIVSSAIGAFSMLDIVKNFGFPFILLLILALSILIIVFRKKKDGLDSTGRIILEDDTADFKVNYNKPKWAYGEKEGP